jgi:hypothetical protein
MMPSLNESRSEAHNSACKMNEKKQTCIDRMAPSAGAIGIVYKSILRQKPLEKRDELLLNERPQSI